MVDKKQIIEYTPVIISSIVVFLIILIAFFQPVDAGTVVKKEYQQENKIIRDNIGKRSMLKYPDRYVITIRSGVRTELVYIDKDTYINIKIGDLYEIREVDSLEEPMKEYSL